MTEKELFNKKNPDFSNGDLRIEYEFRTIEAKIENCERGINSWRDNGDDSGLKPESRDAIASVAIRLLKKKPPLPLKYIDEKNLEKVKNNRALLNSVAQFLQIEPKKLKKLL